MSFFVVPQVVDVARHVHGEGQVDDVLQVTVLYAVCCFHTVRGLVVAVERGVSSDGGGLAVLCSGGGGVDGAAVAGCGVLRARQPSLDASLNGYWGACALRALDQAHWIGDTAEVLEVVFPALGVLGDGGGLALGCEERLRDALN